MKKRKRRPTRRRTRRIKTKLHWKEVDHSNPKEALPAVIPPNVVVIDPARLHRFEQGLVLLADHITGLSEQLTTFKTRMSYLSDRIIALEDLYKQLGHVDVMKFTPDYFHKWLGRLQRDIADLRDKVEHEREQQRRGRL